MAGAWKQRPIRYLTQNGCLLAAFRGATEKIEAVSVFDHNFEAATEFSRLPRPARLSLRLRAGAPIQGNGHENQAAARVCRQPTVRVSFLHQVGGA